MTGALAGAVAIALIAAPAMRQPEEPPSVVTWVTHEHVDVTATFEGQSLFVFGGAKGMQPDDDMVVVLHAPNRDLFVTRKRQRFGLWISSRPVRMEGAPAYYALASTRRLELIAPTSNLRRLRIGADNAPLRAVGPQGAAASAQIAEMRRAIARIKERKGLYSDSLGLVEVLPDQGLFRAEFDLPPGAPTGRYEAEAHLFRDGRAIASARADIDVRHVGVERWVRDLAYQRPLLYGCVAIAFALAAGWAAAAAFRRT